MEHGASSCKDGKLELCRICADFSTLRRLGVNLIRVDRSWSLSTSAMWNRGNVELWQLFLPPCFLGGIGAGTDGHTLR